jgi:hypothetical protein
LLSSRGTQARETVPVDRTLPDEQFIDREHVAAAGVLKREQTTAHGSNHLSLATEPKTVAVIFRLGPILRGYLPMKARRFVRRQKR